MADLSSWAGNARQQPREHPVLEPDLLSRYSLAILRKQSIASHTSTKRVVIGAGPKRSRSGVRKSGTTPRSINEAHSVAGLGVSQSDV